MYQIIERYINKMSIDDVLNFANTKNVNLSDDELNFTYKFIKKNWNQILFNPSSLNLERYKNVYSEENYNKINNLIKEYYQKYRRFI